MKLRLLRIETKTGDINVHWKFEKRDLWFGIYWDYRKSVESPSWWLDFYLCPIPLFPIHIAIHQGYK